MAHRSTMRGGVLLGAPRLKANLGCWTEARIVGRKDGGGCRTLASYAKNLSRSVREINLTLVHSVSL